MARIAPIALGVSTAAGICVSAAGQPAVQYSLHWSDVGGTPNGSLQPPESASIVLDVAFTPAVGATIAYTSPPPGGTGTVAGLGALFLDVASTCGGGSGMWTLSGPGFGGTTGTTWGLRAGWNVGGPGAPQPDGSVRNINLGQVVVPGQTANPLNPVIEIWRGKWSPSSYSARVVTFTAQPAAAAGGTTTASLLVRYGTGPGGEPLYTYVPVPTNPASVHIPIGGMVPMPALCFCYANCDASTTAPTLTVNDFVCFNNRFAAGQSYANCDGSTAAPVLNVNDFTCFLNRYAAGCPFPS